MNKKMFYEAPYAELIELNLDSNQMQNNSPVNGGPGPNDEVDDQGDF